MKITSTLNDRLNQQITAEFSASHAYLAMACALDRMGLKILAKWFLQQHDEERDHAMKILHYLQEVDGMVTLGSIPKPATQFESVEEIVRAALDSEREVTRAVNELVALAEAEKDYATRSLLNWFIDEQVEEEARMNDLLALVQLAGDNMLLVEERISREPPPPPAN